MPDIIAETSEHDVQKISQKIRANAEQINRGIEVTCPAASTNIIVKFPKVYKETHVTLRTSRGRGDDRTLIKVVEIPEGLVPKYQLLLDTLTAGLPAPEVPAEEIGSKSIFDEL